MKPDGTTFRIGSRPATSGDSASDQHDAILKVALRLLEENGYADVTTDSIAAEASVSKTTLYRLWRTKQHIVIDAVRLRFQALDIPDLDSFQAEVNWVLEHRLDDYRQPGILRLVAGLIGAATTDEELRMVFEEWVEQLSRALRKVIQRGVARGDVRSDIDSLGLETVISGVIARSVVAQRSFSVDTVREISSLIAAAAKPC